MSKNHRFMKTKIRRTCKCGCGSITNPGRRYILGHNGKDPSKKTRRKLSLAKMGNINTLGYKQSEEHILKNSVSRMKYNPNDPYCDIWKNREYRKDLRKDYCENKDCKGNYKRLVNHHIDLDKKNCHPKNVMTLCASCHSILHHKLRDGKQIVVEPKNFLIINRSDRIVYINKKTRKKFMLRVRLNLIKSIKGE